VSADAGRSSDRRRRNAQAHETAHTAADPTRARARLRSSPRFIPTGASRISLVERWFATLTDKQLRRGVHRSTRELRLFRYISPSITVSPNR
jgi:hypothetical protein